MIILIAAALVVGVGLASAGWAIFGGSRASDPVADPTHSAAPVKKPDPAPTDSGSTECPGATKTAKSAVQLEEALSSAKPGTVIELYPGTYEGNFQATTSGTSANPIWLCGGSNAILNGGNISKGYTLHLDNVSYWNLAGFTIHGGQKGLMLDSSDHNTVDALTVSGIGDEGIHLRHNSSSNLVENCNVSDTGLLKSKFGEGIYVGTSVNNWATVMGSSTTPDQSDNNVLKGNTISNTTAENIDIKEGTTGGQILDNSFDGVGMVASAATAWVNVKGNDWTISGNHGVNSIGDGFSTHQILDGWGTGNVFSNNVADVNGPGYGYHLTKVLANVVECNNQVSGAARGLSNTNCSAG